MGELLCICEGFHMDKRAENGAESNKKGTKKMVMVYK
jgi:hypothetical protein